MENKAALIPYPSYVEWREGNFLLKNDAGIFYEDTKLAEYLIEQVKSLSGVQLKTASSESSADIILEKVSSAINTPGEYYKLEVTGSKIIISAKEDAGIFRGIQTFFQLIPADIKSRKSAGEVNITACMIEDTPQFQWRGLNLDCCRHFMSKDFIKRYIDILAYYKFNVFHWHLTEDQGWRIEIKKYPLLTKVGAWRKEGDGSVYGGYYTQEDIKEIVAYAESRFITVVPEIEMPGHALASLASYPQNSCTGGPFEVTNVWGVHKDIYCAGRDSTFYFLQDIIDEVCSLFPGRYIHIGGDEAPKDRWKECPRCQARIKAEGLKDEHELQSYFITRMSKYINSKGKEVIGWDEILQGGLAPGAIVQSWQGFEGAVEAARLGHYTICSPASHTYLNSSPEDLDLRVAYSFNPVPAELTGDEKKFVIGSEANLWSEHAPQERVDLQLFPRILALAEIFWSGPQNNRYDEFYQRVQDTYKDLEARGINYGAETKAVIPSTSYDADKNEFVVNIQQGQKGLDIFYTTDGSEPGINSTLYTAPIRIKETTQVKITAFRGNQHVGKTFNLAFDFHKALNAKLTIVNAYDERYRAGGYNSVIDGVRGTNNFRDGSWQGYNGVDFEAVIDLGSVTPVSQVVPRFILDSNSWIFLPESVTVSLSADAREFSNEQTVINDVDQKNSEIILKDFNCTWKGVSARYIKVKAKNIKVCPPWHPGAGSKAWLFIDEVVVR